jgi:Ca2+-binding RTX toxin-like protein
MLVKECNAAGLTAQETAIVLGTAYKESSLGLKLKGESATEYGLFHYNKPTWDDNHKNIGDRSDPLNQTKAFINDLKQYKAQYDMDQAMGIIRPPDMSFGEYAYNKHMLGRNTDWILGRDENGDGIWDISPASKEWREKVQGKLPEFEGYVTGKQSDGSLNDPKFGDINGPFLPWWLNNSLKDLMDKNTDLYRQFFTTAKVIKDPTILSPIVLDLDGDGIETTNVKDGAYFDHDGNGFAERTGWAGADDGILVMDRDSNGSIDSGKELFGNETLLNDGTKASNGFQALAELDDNADGKIDANDASWSQLKVWTDTDGDGYSTAEEMHTLDELGIASINTGYTNSTTVDTQGNEHKQIGSFTRTDGTTSATEDVWFQRDTDYTIANEWLDVPDDIAALPDLQGYGNVYDLHQAMVRDTSGQLKALVEQFVNATDTSVRNSLMDQILYKWTGSDTIDPASRGGNIDARKLSVLEKLYGEAFSGVGGANPNVNAAALLNQSYSGLYEMFYAQLMAQTHLKSIYDKITYTWDDATQSVRGDLNPAITEIQNRLNADYETGKQTLSEFSRSIQGFQAEDMMNFSDFQYYFASQGPELGSLVGAITGNIENNILSGNSSNNIVFSYEGNDLIYGNSGNDMVYGSNGNDALFGGNGHDLLVGGGGDDVIFGDETQSAQFIAANMVSGAPERRVA